jgi:LmbE family N-acetylglucosaminyl deacetylase
MARELPAVSVHWIVFSSGGARAAEARAAAGRFLQGFREVNIEILDFRNGFFPYVATEIKEFFEGLKGRASPDVIFTHYRQDLHQDHRLLCELTWNTYRDHLILEYEIPKYDGDIGAPNFFVPLSRGDCDRKIAHILECFPSQRDKHWFTEDVFRAIMRLRGVESASPGGFAEGFYCRKLVV